MNKKIDEIRVHLEGERDSALLEVSTLLSQRQTLQESRTSDNDMNSGQVENRGEEEGHVRR